MAGRESSLSYFSLERDTKASAGVKSWDNVSKRKCVIHALASTLQLISYEVISIISFPRLSIILIINMQSVYLVFRPYQRRLARPPPSSEAFDLSSS
jgi:hypothetical protein